MAQQKKRPPRRKLPNPDQHSMHQQHHQVRAMKEQKHLPSYKNIMKEYQDKVASINFRNDMLQRQRNANYRNEYDRMRGILDHSVLRGESLARLHHRGAYLARMLDGGL
jgi:hypothetical protein